MFQTVGELVAKLQEMPQDILVILSCDAEGRSVSAIDDLSTGRCVDQERAGFGFLSDDPDERPEDAPFDPAEGVPAVCLWPIG